LALASAYSSSITGATFFSFREYVVGPLRVLYVDGSQDLRQNGGVEGSTQRNRHLSWSEMRTHKLLDSSISGALTGGLLYSFRRGSKGIIPGATTAGLVCTLLQLIYNESTVLRVKYVSQKLAETRPSPVYTPGPAHTSSPTATVADVSNHREPPKAFSERFFDFLGMPKMSDEEFLEKLRVKRDSYMRRIVELEAEREKERPSKSL
ncbi:hypothetical protein BC835DRAFT_1279928, partial [Cytidiella melzeri]